MVSDTANPVRLPAQPYERFLLAAVMALVLLGSWTMLVAAMGILHWFSTTEGGMLLIAAMKGAQQAAIFLYESYDTPTVLSSMLGIWLAAAVVEGVVSSCKED